MRVGNENMKNCMMGQTKKQQMHKPIKFQKIKIKIKSTKSDVASAKR